MKSLACLMNSPNEVDYKKMNRLTRNLIKHPMTTGVFPEWNMYESINVGTVAVCVLTTRSTGLATPGRRVKHHSTVQWISMRGASEWYGVKGSLEHVEKKVLSASAARRVSATRTGNNETCATWICLGSRASHGRMCRTLTSTGKRNPEVK